ncbi:ABC-2 transporter permease [Gorillibacterium sp. CAU 1737]|uniref:ABC-2 transporter permease n=1 Tax=Gorillibacterium sp. CAU 1737 TaxID=3140362 RepID=UPI0032615526
MGNLILKDLRVHSKIGALLLVWALGFLLFLGAKGLMGFTVGYYVPLFFTIIIVSAEFKNQNLLFINSLPVTRRDIVNSKFAIALATSILGVVLSIGISLMQKGGEASMPLEWTIALTLLVFSLCLLTLSLYLPMVFWLGEKALLFVSVLISALFIFLTSSFKDLSGWIGTYADSAAPSTLATLLRFPGMLLLPALSLGTLFIAWLISARVLEKKDLG